MQKKKAAKKSNLGQLGAVGAGLAGLAATAYFFFGPDGKKNQQQAKAWALKMKAEVVEKLEKAREVSEPSYRAMIDTVAAKYEKQLQSSPAEVQKLAQDLKNHWQTLVKPKAAAKQSVVKKKVVVKKKPATPVKKKVVKGKK